jgi:mannosylglycerate hydrolase
VTLTFHLIPHTHWDREWYLPRAAFTARLIPALDDLLSLLETNPLYRSFLLDGQTVLVEDYLAVRPDRESGLRALAQGGRLQLGPWYVLADELIPSGESLIRNLLYGAADTARWGGRLEVLYSPDAFGHPAALPSLAREFGFKTGALWRGLGGEPGQTRDAYRWRGSDGREVLLWHFPPDGYEAGAALPIDRDRLRQAWAPLRAELTRRAATTHIAVPVGADHHAPSPDLPTLRERLAELEPQNAVRISRLDEFLKELASEAAQAPEVAGELRWSYRYTWTLQAVHSARAPLKRRHAKAELHLERIAEPLAALARRAGGRDRRPLLDRVWRTLIRGQFHDTLCGCCADPVARAFGIRLDAVEATTRELADAAADDLSGHDPDATREHPQPDSSLWLWNPVARTRAGLVVADTTWFRRDVLVGPPGSRRARHGTGAEEFALVGSDGVSIPVQVLGRRHTLERRDAPRHYPDQDEVEQVRIAFHAPALEGLAAAVLRAGPPVPQRRDAGAQVRGRTLSNPLIEVTVDPTGALTLVDRRTGERFEGLLRLEEQRDRGDLYTGCPEGKPVRAAGPIRVRRLAGGPLLAALEVGIELPGSSVRLVVQVFDESPMVRCLLDVTNRARQSRLRARCPIGVAGPALAGSAFVAVSRPALTVRPEDYPRETPVTTAPAQRFVAAAQGNRGLGVLAPGFFEYEWTSEGDLTLTLLRGAGELSRDDLPTRPGHAGWPTATPDGQCLGRDQVELVLVPVGARDLEAGETLPELWEDAFLPPRARWLREADLSRARRVGVTLDGRGLVLSAVKPAQAGSGLILRCYNARRERVVGAWRLPDTIRTAHRVRADERAAQPLVVEGRGHTVRFIAEPHEIVTILIT